MVSLTNEFAVFCAFRGGENAGSYGDDLLLGMYGGAHAKSYDGGAMSACGGAVLAKKKAVRHVARTALTG